jgi:GTP cyclohydrolase II
VGKIRLLSNFPRNLVSLPGYGLEILECVPLRLAPPKPSRKLRPQRARTSRHA